MLSLQEKISYFENSLRRIENNYADSFKCNISLFFGDFNLENQLLKFLDKLNSLDEIENWISKLTSRIVMKFDEEHEQINDFIYDYLNNG